jgi:hypothetical protein
MNRALDWVAFEWAWVLMVTLAGLKKSGRRVKNSGGFTGD